MDFKPEQLLGDAIEAARHALRDLDSDQVPASLRRIAGYAGGTLPPPFARSLVSELAVNEFLRSKALDAWAGERPPTRADSLASYRFLERGAGWSMDVATAAFGQGARAAAMGDRALEVERDAFEAEAASLRERLKTMRKDHRRLEGELKRVTQMRREPAKEERIAERRRTDELEEASRLHASALTELEARLTSARRELDAAREQALLDRRLRADAESAHRAAVAPESPTMDPDALAERLDVIAALAAAAGPSSALDDGRSEVGALDSLQFPAKIRPDTSEAIEWLVDAGNSIVLIDGYNVGFLLAERLDGARARMLVAEVAGRLAATAKQAEIVVVFDSEIASNGGTSQRTGRVEVFYPDHRSADDEIVERSGRRPRTVVITNDRDVRHRAEAVGAIALWSDALAEWSRRR
jgi:hypothetical protein